MNKQALSEALAEAEYRIEQGGLISPPYVDRTLFTLVDAARLVERLLPGECEVCEGTGEVLITRDIFPCRSCHDGRVWDEGIVEAVAAAIFDSGLVGDDTAWGNLELDEEWIREEYRRHARAALSALVELLTEKVP